MLHPPPTSPRVLQAREPVDLHDCCVSAVTEKPKESRRWWRRRKWVSQKKEDRGGKRQGRENSVRNVDSGARFPLPDVPTVTLRGGNSGVSNLQREKFRLRSRLHPQHREGVSAASAVWEISNGRTEPTRGWRGVGGGRQAGKRFRRRVTAT